MLLDYKSHDAHYVPAGMRIVIWSYKLYSRLAVPADAPSASAGVEKDTISRDWGQELHVVMLQETIIGRWGQALVMLQITGSC